MDFWHVLPVAVALVFIIEGMLPFISPNRWRNMLALAAQMEDRVIRNIGLGSMLFGVLVLYLVLFGAAEIALTVSGDSEMTSVDRWQLPERGGGGASRPGSDRGAFAPATA